VSYSSNIQTLFSGPSTTSVSPHSGLAVGPNYVVMIEGARIEWTNLTEGIANPAIGHGFFSPLSPTDGLYDPRVVYDGEDDDAYSWEVRVRFVDLAPSATGPRSEIFLHQINVASVGTIKGEQCIRQTVQIQSRWQADRFSQKTSANSPAVLVDLDLEAIGHARHLALRGAIARRAGRAGIAAETRARAIPRPIRMVLANPVGAVAGDAGHERERVLAGETARFGALGEVDRGRSASHWRQGPADLNLRPSSRFL
jgi:hypothetical protein